MLPGAGSTPGLAPGPARPPGTSLTGRLSRAVSLGASATQRLALLNTFFGACEIRGLTPQRIGDSLPEAKCTAEAITATCTADNPPSYDPERMDYSCVLPSAEASTPATGDVQPSLTFSNLLQPSRPTRRIQEGDLEYFSILSWETSTPS